jgi:uncharacterized membrane protein YkvA (DUF1232 family)
MIARLKEWARRLKRDVLALWLAARDPRTPLTAKLVAGAVAAYAFSPIDLIPDIIPVIGWLDEALILPLGIALAVRLIPAPLMAEFRARAVEIHAKPRSRTAAVAIFLVWLALAAGAALLLWRLIG